MSTVIPGFPHASVERLCDYELPEPPASTLFSKPPEAEGPEKLALAWWLWMDEMGKSVLRYYDAWRDQLDRTTANGPTRKG
ncbi:hypothetical protein QMO14_09140 [Variovorax sp. CAN2819]|uniref:hypothetical protein n=1 Tax=Variovorax sp. CAN15 TaxID=3046727 RepID=UPI0026499B60|nr:hypothetical protein [Variovorax sp. CAN15]MDN6883759.1 hypothetical protein [Variovorax sp. CAN15]